MTAATCSDPSLPWHHLGSSPLRHPGPGHCHQGSSPVRQQLAMFLIGMIHQGSLLHPGPPLPLLPGHQNLGSSPRCHPVPGHQGSSPLPQAPSSRHHHRARTQLLPQAPSSPHLHHWARLQLQPRSPQQLYTQSLGRSRSLYTQSPQNRWREGRGALIV